MDRNLLCGMAHWGKVIGNWVGLGFLVPLLILLLKGKDDELIASHAKTSLNGEISYLIYGIVSFLLSFILIGVVGYVLIVVFWIIGVIKNSIAASKGEEPIQYIWAINFLK